MSLPLARLKQISEKGDEDEQEAIWMTTWMERYRSRPKNEEFNEMCMGTFCSQFRLLAKSQIKGVNNEYKLQHDRGIIKRRTRTKPAILRYPRFSKDAQPEKYFLAQLQLFFPHRTDNDLKPPSFPSHQFFYQSGQTAYSGKRISVKSLVEHNRMQFETNTTISLLEEKNFSEFSLEDGWAQLAPESELLRAELANDRGPIGHSDEEDNCIPDLSEDKKSHGYEYHSVILPENEAIKILRSLNSNQRRLFYFIHEWCLKVLHDERPAPFHVYLTGGAGTGKSHAIKAIYYQASKILGKTTEIPDDITVALSASTGIAAYNIGGSTLHSLFKLPLHMSKKYIPLGEAKINTIRSYLSSLRILIIDEVSMVSDRVLLYIHGRLKQIKHETRDDPPFGGVSILAVGDFYQLYPVKASSVLDGYDPLRLWEDNFKIAVVDQIMRQKGDYDFAMLLNRLRLKKKVENLCEQDINILKSRESDQDHHDCLHIYATNKQVNEHNSCMLKMVCKNTYTVKAKVKDGNAKELKSNQTRRTYSSSLQDELVIGIQARVMLTKNISVADGLINGACGLVKEIEVYNTNELIPKKIWVKFDCSNIRNENEINERGTAITMCEEYQTNGTIVCQFPLKLAWACTVHKTQGLTVEKALVSFKKIFNAGQIYVALSRVSKLENLIIKSFDEKAIYCNENVGEALSHLSPLFPIETPKNYDVVLFNIQGLSAHIQDMINDERFLSSSYIYLTEVGIKHDVEPANYTMQGYTLRYLSRSTSYSKKSKIGIKFKDAQGGGVGLYYKTGLNVDVVQLQEIDVEYMTTFLEDRQLCICVIYRPPSYPQKDFLYRLEKILYELEHCFEKIIVFGDFNSDIMKGSKIETFMIARGYYQCVNFATIPTAAH